MCVQESDILLAGVDSANAHERMQRLSKTTALLAALPAESRAKMLRDVHGFNAPHIDLLMSCCRGATPLLHQEGYQKVPGSALCRLVLMPTASRPWQHWSQQEKGGNMQAAEHKQLLRSCSSGLAAPSQKQVVRCYRQFPPSLASRRP